jgi:hypothetical protein
MPRSWPPAPAGSEWVHARPLRQPRARGKPPSPPTDPTPTDSPASSPSMIRRRPSASSSFVLGPAASGSTSGRSNWTPPTRRRQPGQLRGSPHKNSQPTPTTTTPAGPNPHALLTRPALMGAFLQVRSAQGVRPVQSSPRHKRTHGKIMADRSASSLDRTPRCDPGCGQLSDRRASCCCRGPGIASPASPVAITVPVAK